jgi:hypothetical protein
MTWVLFALACIGWVRADANSIEVVSERVEDAFALVGPGRAATIYVDPNDAPVVRIAAEAFTVDVERVTGVSPILRVSAGELSEQAVIIGTLGRSVLVDQLVQDGKLAVNSIRGQWETFVIAVVDRPAPSVERALVIAGSDRRGTAFGVFELSRMMGVSPWIWWADVPPKHRDALYVTGGATIEGPPSVKYRGIFLNDEDWGLQPWAAKNMDTDIRDIGPKTYARIFELLLRLKANYIWPAMHPCTKAFYYYGDNPKVADRYAIVVGSSHCEPMLRNNVFEWAQNFEHEYNVKPGDWRYDTNRDQIHRYWEDRVRQASSYESVFTIGMRGIHDSGIPGPRALPDKIMLLEQIMADQRGLLGQYFAGPVQDIPQIFCPYKEVLTVYRAGLKLPDDVTIVWADDNHGYIRQLSNADEQKRQGGSGVYYHLSYWGAPHDYLWLSSTSPSLISYEMTKAYRYGASRLWVFNVGDIKPAEMETQFALDLAWNVEAWPPEKAHGYAQVWAAATFGSQFAGPIAEIKKEYYRLAQAAKPEHASSVTFDGGEIAERLRSYRAIVDQAEALGEKIPERLRDAYFELILYPVQGACLMNEKVLCAAESLELAKRGDNAALEYARRAQAAFERIQVLTHTYNEEIAGGKWAGMMSWHPRDLDVFKMPRVATAAMIAETGQSATRETSGKVIWAADYVRSREAPGTNLQVIDGLGRNGRGLALMPFTVSPVSPADVRNAAFVEYDVGLSAGARQITIKCLPTHPIHESWGLRYAVSVNGDSPQIVDIQASTEDRAWRTNVLRGYSQGQTVHDVSVAGKTVIRIYLLDPGLVLNAIEVR